MLTYLALPSVRPDSVGVVGVVVVEPARGRDVAHVVRVAGIGRRLRKKKQCTAM